MKKSKLISKIYLCVVFALFSGISFGQANRKLITVPDGRKVEASVLNQYIVKAMDSIGIPGLSIAIVNKNEIVYDETFGFKNVETNEPVTKETIFEGASLSKPLFAYFIMKMVEKGEIALDKPIYPHLEPIFPEGVVAPESLAAYKTLTPRIILSHGTGIPNWVEGEPIQIAFEPGTDFSYSGEAYQHLGAAFGTKKGIGWGSELDALFINEVAHPLGMDRSLYTWNNNLDKDAARGHIDGKVNPEINRYKKVGPGFSLHSNAHNYALF